MEIARLPAMLRIETGLTLVAGSGGLDRHIHSPVAVHLGLAPTGWAEPPPPGRILLLGSGGVAYLSVAAPATRARAAAGILEGGPPCVIVTDAAEPTAELVAAAEAGPVPLFVTSAPLAAVAVAIHDALDGRIVEGRSVHGVMLDVNGVGVLLLGPSGLGKSEAGLELVMRGHRLVADDVVDLTLHQPATVIGSGNEILRHAMEIRGLGIVDVRDLFGIASVREAKRVELVVRLEEWQPGKHYERLGLRESTYDLLGVALPLVVIPVAPGRSLSSVIEVAARGQLLKWMGHDSVGLLERRLVAGARDAGTKGDQEEGIE